MSYRYSSVLEGLLQGGAKYIEIEKISPLDFHLSKKWETENKKNSILWSIVQVFNLMENQIFSPDLRSISKEIEAPYSVLMEAHKYANHIK